MNESEREELLSAYLDGELAPSERAEIDIWLASSAEARSTLAEIRRLSVLLRELPRLDVPGEFAAQVMQHAERRMLLPEVPVRRIRRGRQILYIGGPLAAAAMLLVLINLNRDPDPNRAVSKHEAGVDGGGSNGPSRVADGLADGSEGIAPMVADRTSVNSSSSDPSTRRAALADAETLSMKSGGPATPPLAGGVAEMPGKESGSRSRDGQFDALVASTVRHSTAEKVAVIRLTYDVDELPGVKLVLKALDESVPGGESALAESVAAGADKPAVLSDLKSKVDSGNQFEGLYVEVTVEQLNRMLETVFADSKVIDGQIRIESEAMDIAALEDSLQFEIQDRPESRKLLSRSDPARGSGIEKGGTAKSLKSPAVVEEGAGGTESLPPPKSESRRISKPELKEKLPVANKTRPTARKQHVMLSPDYRRLLERQDPEADKRTGAAPESQRIARKRSNADNEPERARRFATPVDYVRVLFVVESRPSPSARPAP